MLRGYLLVIASAIGFGVNPLFATMAYRAGVDVPTVLLFRFGVATILLWAICLTRGLVEPVAPRAIAAVALAGLTYCLQAATYFYAVQQVSAGLAALLLYLYPCLVALIGALVARVRPSGLVVLSLVLSFVGIALALGKVAGGSWLGIAAGVVTAMFYTAYVFLTDHLGGRVPPMLATAGVTTCAVLLLTVQQVATGTFHPMMASRAWVPVILVGVLGGAIAISTFYAGVKIVGPTQASIVSTVEPIISVVGSAVVLGAAMTATQWLGAVLVLTGAGVAILAHARQPHAHPDEVPVPPA